MAGYSLHNFPGRREFNNLSSSSSASRAENGVIWEQRGNNLTLNQNSLRELSNFCENVGNRSEDEDYIVVDSESDIDSKCQMDQPNPERKQTNMVVGSYPHEWIEDIKKQVMSDVGKIIDTRLRKLLSHYSPKHESHRKPDVKMEINSEIRNVQTTNLQSPYNGFTSHNYPRNNPIQTAPSLHNKTRTTISCKNLNVVPNTGTTRKLLENRTEGQTRLSNTAHGSTKRSKASKKTSPDRPHVATNTQEVVYTSQNTNGIQQNFHRADNYAVATMTNYQQLISGQFNRFYTQGTATQLRQFIPVARVASTATAKDRSHSVCPASFTNYNHTVLQIPMASGYNNGIGHDLQQYYNHPYNLQSTATAPGSLKQ